MTAGIQRFLIAAVVIIACFAKPIARLARFAFTEDLFSYVILVPLISGYFVWIRREEFFRESEGIRWPALFPVLACLGLLEAARQIMAAGGKNAAINVLALHMLSFCCLLWSGSIYFLGLKRMRVFAFPALFLVFLAPIPPAILDAAETVLQHASAHTAAALIKLSNIPIYQSGLELQMPGIVLSVAKECSGIRSTLVLFIASLVGGNLLLRRSWTRCALALLVIPLGILRNAFRILVLAMLCVRVDLSYIHSPIHKRGGPLFFILSLIPFGIALFLMRRIENRKRSQAPE
jgi:exosortase C (VPDSG-CTERM-specific)